MDFVKTEEQNNVEDDNYDVYINNIPDYQHTAISMEQLHQAMQSTLNTGSIHHNFQLPLSPRQMSTLMLKTNHLSRNLNFNDIPTHLSRNLSSEMDLAQNLTTEQSLNLRHEEILNQNLRHNLDVVLTRSLSNDIELHNTMTQSFVQNISEQDITRGLGVDLSDNLSRINDVLPQNLVRTDQSVQDLSHELDLSQLNRQNLGTETILMSEERRTPIVVQTNHIQQNLLQRLDQNIIQRLDPNFIQRLDPNLIQRLDQRLVNGLVQESRLSQENEHLLPTPFNIKMEQEDDGYFYSMNPQGLVEGNAADGQLQVEQQASTPNVQDNQIYSIYNNHLTNIAGLNPVDLYSRPQNFSQTYIENNVTAENPQNLVVHRQFENTSPFTEKHHDEENSVEHAKTKNEQPKENLKPTDQNKIFYSGYNQNNYSDNPTEKNENDTSEQNKVNMQDFSMNIKGEYECFKCHKIFPSKRGLKQHAKVCLESNEEEEKNSKFSCTQCAYRCQSPAILKIHERTHTGEKPFSCTFCDYKSGQKNNVAKHILVHMKEKPFRCQYCDYRCAQKNNLVVHERTHTGHKPFACPYCDYRTVQKPNLVKHMYLHTDQKPFSCDMCNYRCVQKTNLTKHKQRHLNEKGGEKLDLKNDIKPYKPRQKSVKCPHCSYRCVQKSSLEKHLQFKHTDLSSSDFPQENIDHELMNEAYNNETIQNLSVKKEQTVFVDVNQEKHVEPLQIMS